MQQGTIRDVRVPRDPSAVGSAPVDVLPGFVVEHVLERRRCFWNYLLIFFFEKKKSNDKKTIFFQPFLGSYFFYFLNLKHSPVPTMYPAVEWITPLGFPVDPEVYSLNRGCSASTHATGDDDGSPD